MRAGLPERPLLGPSLGSFGAGLSGAGLSGGLGEPEIDLLLGAIDFGDLNLDAVAEADDLAGAPSDELAAGGIEGVEFVLNGGKGYQAGHGEIRDIDEEAEVADVRDERRVTVRLAVPQLGFEVGEQLDVLAVAFGVGGVAFGEGEMVGRFLEGGTCLGVFVEEGAVDDEVGVTADGGGEVGVMAFGEAEVAEGFDGVAGAHQGLEESDLEGGPDGEGVQAMQEALDFGALGEVAAGDIVGEDLLAVFAEAPFIGGLVDAVNGRDARLDEAAGDGLVGKEHVLLDELVGFVVFDLLDPFHATLVIEADLHFREIQGEGSFAKATLAQALGQAVGVVEHVFDGIGGRAAEDAKHLAVGEPALRMDHGGMEGGLEDLAVVGDQEFDGFGQTVHPGSKRTEFVAEGLGEHGDDAIDEVGRIATAAGFGIEGGTGLHIVRHVGDVDPEPPAAGPGGFERDRVVEVLGVVRIDRDHRVAPAVDPAGGVAGMDGVPVGSGLLEDAPGEMEGKVVLAEHGEHVHALVVGSAEHLDDLAFGLGVVGFPFLEFNDHLVALPSWAPDIPGFGHGDVVGDSRIVRNHIKQAPAVTERSDELIAATFENADDRAGILVGGMGAESLGGNIAPDEDPVFMQGGGRGAFGNDNLADGRIVGNEKALSLAVNADAPRDEVGFAREDVAFALDADELGGPLQAPDEIPELGAPGFGEAQVPEEVWEGCGDVVRFSQPAEQLVFHR